MTSTLLILGAWNKFEAECHRYVRGYRRLIWRETFHNIVVTEGKNLLLTRSFVTVGANVLWYVGLKAAGTVAASDTMGSHAGWAELGSNTYSNATRPVWTPGTVAAGSVDNSASKAVFTCTGTQTVAGCFLSTSSTRDGTTGSLYGAGDFSASRAVANGDTLSITETLTV